ncbi:hypothetical protein [Xylanibacter rodentium]|jgi:hypothetical protein|uniref:DUF4377 domain-containing protein n=3 Tax=Xylanibacter rodentium TaxID=2736289 RepID=A0ABX2AXV8_9BACT|nr:hypothetical protein [Xylanibacter rodentium]NPE12192.1 hypothetical protein [Prevotella sp. PJ1A]NPE14480.1 hypothetical protein [Xylanibacter rodentium]NPE39676.1 hypothetical protein [Prevotella sp. PCJ2]
MKKLLFLLFIIVVSLYSCSSQDDYDFDMRTKHSPMQESTRSVEEKYEDVNFHLCVTYSPSMTDCVGLVSFSRIILYSYFGDDAYNPPLIGSYNVDYYSQSQCLGGSFNYDRMMTFSIPSKDMLIQNERWYMTVEIDIAPYLKFGDYKVILYNAFQEDWTIELGEVICTSVQAGDKYQMPMTELMNEYTGQRDFYLQLYVVPYNN